ncbi:hypothetical protein K505DRAFT_358825 [Melanomma pulvis-pyrius CBS 109.77]|uniref:Uncharacterized protein n=1 Tax=Melanomma pulvis-pyrius CBS 109.77 TaxID=1314802 RepID=A0A6A6XKU7_9PLEO|nr:hypothetical protein K505DRAFT_358825 [Melanomma pulvis-pyrius CBS 109.77]
MTGTLAIGSPIQFREDLNTWVPAAPTTWMPEAPIWTPSPTAWAPTLTIAPTPIPSVVTTGTATNKDGHIDTAGKFGMKWVIAIVSVLVGLSILGVIYFKYCRGNRVGKHQSNSNHTHASNAYSLRDLPAQIDGGAGRHYRAPLASRNHY